MTGAFFAAFALCAVAHKKTASKTALTAALYFALQILLECQIRATESSSALAQLFKTTFFSMVIVKGLTYAAIVFIMMTHALFLLKITPRLKHYVAPALMTVWLVCVPAIETTPGIFYFVYLMPCELFYFGLAVYARRHLPAEPDDFHTRTARQLFKTMMSFAVIILLEDILCDIDYGFFERGYQIVSSNVPEFAKMRNYCECVMQLLFAYIAFAAYSRVLVSGEVAENGERADEAADGTANADTSEVETGPVEAEAEVSPVLMPLLPQSAVNKLADELNLSPREREVLPLLLARMSIQLMSDTLMISKGTVKSHVHNIYQKAGVSDREALILYAGDFVSA